METKKQETAQADLSLVGIGGWLLLPAIVLILGVIAALGVVVYGFIDVSKSNFIPIKTCYYIFLAGFFANMLFCTLPIIIKRIQIRKTFTRSPAMSTLKGIATGCVLVAIYLMTISGEGSPTFRAVVFALASGWVLYGGLTVFRLFTKHMDTPDSFRTLLWASVGAHVVLAVLYVMTVTQDFASNMYMVGALGLNAVLTGICISYLNRSKRADATFTKGETSFIPGNVYSVFRREFASYFNTPIGYVYLAFFLLLTKALFASSIFTEGKAEMRGFFGMMPLFFLFFIPAISMRLWSEERKLGTLEWLLTLPMNAWQAVVGKYLAGLAFIGVFLVLTLDIPIFLKIYGNPDVGQIAGGYLGAMVLGMVYLAIGAFASSLTADQIVAFVVAVAISFAFFLMGYGPVLDWMKDIIGGNVTATVQLFGIDYHFESICRGVLDTRDLLYAVTMSGVFLFLNYLVVDHRS